MMVMLGMMVTVVTFQRLMELYVAKRNANKLKALGAYEVGQSHYKYMVLVHVSFLISLVVESFFWPKALPGWWPVILVVFLALQAFRIWCIWSLGIFWNTRIIVLPGAKRITRGPYRFMRHPNYVIVVLEIITLSLLFQAYLTGVVFTCLKAVLLSVRIPLEEKALQDACNKDNARPYKTGWLHE
jgi:methyltransferase